MQTLLEAAVAGQRNVLLTGDAPPIAALGAALGALIPAERRVVSIGVGVAPARAPAGPTCSRAPISAALVRVAAAFRADHFVVAEAVGPEVVDILLAAARGQEGLIFAAPARTVAEGAGARRGARGGARRGRGPRWRRSCAARIDLVVHVVANADGGARVVDIAEAKVDGGPRRRRGRHQLAQRRGAARERRGQAPGDGVSARLGAALAAVGQSLPSNLVRR